MRVVADDQVARSLGALGAEPRVVVSGNFAAPRRLLEVLDTAVASCRIFVLNAQDALPERPGVTVESPFVGPGSRGHPNLDYLPMRLSLVPRLFTTLRAPDVTLLHTSVPNRGKVSLGIEVNILPAAIEATRRRGGLIVAQLNRAMPYTYGDGEIDVDDVDLAIEVDELLASPASAPSDAACDEIARRVAAFATDAATVQFGIGTIPESVCRHLHARRGLGVWSEMVSDGVVALERAGVLDLDRPIVATFLVGSPELYEWANENPRLRLLRTELVNDPSRIAAQPGMLSVNAALEVDLHAQSNASYVHGRIYSGFGGQPDFVIGALHSDGGHAVVALRAWHDKTERSTIIPVLRSPATSFQHTVVVTEHGAAEIFGRSQAEQAHLLINEAADPRARQELDDEAMHRGIAPRPASSG